MPIVVRARVEVRFGDGVGHQRLPVEVAEVPCVLRPCLRVYSGPRRAGDPPLRCDGLSSLCPTSRPDPDPGLAKERGVGRRRVHELVAQVDLVAFDAAIESLSRVIESILGPEEAA